MSKVLIKYTCNATKKKISKKLSNDWIWRTWKENLSRHSFQTLPISEITQTYRHTLLQVNLCQQLFFLQNMEGTCCVQKLFWMSETISVHNIRFELGIFMYWTCNSMNNLSSYCGLVDAKIRASDKELPVLESIKTL